MKPAKALYLLIAATLAVLALTFLLTRNYLDLASIRRNLMTKERLTKENCLFVFAYIATVNSFLEEAFFRGCLYHAFAEGGEKLRGWRSVRARSPRTISVLWTAG